jgi:hypothetical protein
MTQHTHLQQVPPKTYRESKMGLTWKLCDWVRCEAMAMNLQLALSEGVQGFAGSLHVFNRTAEKAKALVDKGAMAVQSPAGACTASYTAHMLQQSLRFRISVDKCSIVAATWGG